VTALEEDDGRDEKNPRHRKRDPGGEDEPTDQVAGSVGEDDHPGNDHRPLKDDVSEVGQSQEVGVELDDGVHGPGDYQCPDRNEQPQGLSPGTGPARSFFLTSRRGTRFVLSTAGSAR